MAHDDTRGPAAPADSARRSRLERLSRIAGWLGLAVAAPILIWFLAGFLPGVPSMVAVFGVPGLRVPASVFVAGLLIAAVGFRDF